MLVARRCLLCLVGVALAQDAAECSDDSCVSLLQTALHAKQDAGATTEPQAPQMMNDVSPEVPALPAPWMAPPGATAHWGASVVVNRDTSGMPESVNQLAWDNFLLLSRLRREGYTCPGGQRFPPTSGEFEFDCRLWQASYLHSKDMGERGYFDHVSPEGSNPFQRSARTGLMAHGENIAAGQSTAQSVHAAWQKSDGHCTNMMDPAHTRAGVGYAYVGGSPYKHYWTQLFVKHSGPIDTTCYPRDEEPPSEAPIAPASSCEDKSTYCGSWKSSGYCAKGSEYYGTLVEMCRKTCGFCSSAPSPAPGPGARPTPPPIDYYGTCSDKDMFCFAYAAIGYCRDASQKAWMSEHCRASCGLCAR